MILTRSDLKLLTARASRKLICEELDAMGINYALGIDGWPRVLQSHAEDVLCGRSGTKRRTRPDYGTPQTA